MLRRVALFAALALLGVSIAAQTHKVAAPADAGAQTARVPRVARIDAWLQGYVDRGEIPGAVVLVLKDGRVVYEHAAGWSDVEAKKPMTTDALFRIASQTKALTATAIVMLMEEGKLLLTDPVSKYIPTFDKTTVFERGAAGAPSGIVPAKRAITLKDLLTHTAGISYGTDQRFAKLYEEKGLGPAAGYGWYTADKDEPICDTMTRLGTLPFAAQPGEAWVYGYGSDVLGCVVERVSGTPLDVFIHDRITAPLQMRDTFFYVPADKAARLTTVYASDDHRKAVRAPDGAKGQGAYVTGPRKSFAGGAGLVSTARDYARFLEMIRRGGTLDGVRILSEKSAALMTVNAVGTLHSTTGLGYSIAFETTDRFGGNGLSSAGAFGWGGAYASVYRVDPADRLTMLLMIQLIPNSTNIRETFPNVVYQAFGGK